MTTRLLAILIALCLFASSVLSAGEARSDDLKPKTSLDYTMDDGIMSKEEMEAEAQDMFTLCDQNVYQKIYFNCACLAGAFLQQREKLGPMAMQYEIYQTITNSAETDASCANTENVAGRAYASCLGFAGGYSETELDESNEDYCTCVANKMANDFGKAPRLSSPYVESLRYNAMKVCRDPETRKQLKSAAARESEAAKAAAMNAAPAPTTPAPAATD